MCKCPEWKDIVPKGKIVDPSLDIQQALQARINSIMSSAIRIGRLIEQVNDSLRRLEEIIQLNAAPDEADEAEKSEDEGAQELDGAEELEGGQD